jgi:uncharacterized protein (TIRG00374 family)
MEEEQLRAQEQVPKTISRRVVEYFGLSILFFGLSFVAIYYVHHNFSGGKIYFNPAVFSPGVIGTLILLLLLYYLADGLRLYCVIRALGFDLAFSFIIKLVFINIFVSNVTPFSTGGGVIQVYLLKKRGVPIGEATAATLIRTITAALVLFILTPVIIWANPALFGDFFRKKLLGITVFFSSSYIAFLMFVLFRTDILKSWIYRFLFLLKRMKVISSRKFRKLFLRMSHELDLFATGMQDYFKRNPGWALMSILFTLLFMTLLFSFAVVLLTALGYKAPFWNITAFQIVVTFFMYFTPTPGAAGIAEGGFGYFFAHIVRKQDVTMLTFSWRFLTIYIGMGLGILALYREIFNHHRMKKIKKKKN